MMLELNDAVKIKDNKENLLIKVDSSLKAVSKLRGVTISIGDNGKRLS